MGWKFAGGHLPAAGDWCTFPIEWSDNMSEPLPSRRWIVRAALLILLLTTGAPVKAAPPTPTPSETGTLYFKDGFVIQGEIKRDHSLLVDGKEGVAIPKG